VEGGVGHGVGTLWEPVPFLVHGVRPRGLAGCGDVSGVECKDAVPCGEGGA
jgi:hypothetical protein